ncbi:MAG: hypothetical protein Q9211_002527 [Gyalolechia sp. 1 TL-2023]
MTQHIASNHMDMCRFSGLDDHEYRKVVAAFGRIKAQITESQEDRIRRQGVNTIPDDAQRKAFLDALSFPALDARYATIRKAHARTCKWLTQRKEYHDWFDVSKIIGHHGLFWIKGKPGCGKSTLLKFAVQNAKRTKKEAEVISFFFNARGDDLERSTLGMYRSLLWQLLRVFPDLQMLIDCSRYTSCQDGGPYDWKITELQTLFVDAFQKLGQRQLICFIDALDECEESEIRDLITFLEELGEIAISSQIHFRVCLSSRHYPYISIKNGIELTLEGQEGHDQDIAKYLDSELKAGKGRQCEAIKEEIRNRASGVFLWVALVVQILNKEYDHGRVHALRRRLKEIPDGLDKLFEDILTRDRENMDELILCLQWILYATRPLNREELYYAILSGTDLDALALAIPETVSVEDMERFILSCSKGLAETTKATAQHVQFIHESVRDFLVGKNGFNKLKSDLESGQSHDRLKQCCCVYLKTDISDWLPAGMALPVASTQDAKDLRTRVSDRFPFLQYATQSVLSHADRAEQDNVPQADFVEDFAIGDWIKLHNLHEKYQIRRFKSTTTLLSISIKKSLSNLVRTQLARRPRPGTMTEYFQTERYLAPLYAALADSKTSSDTLRVLLNPIIERADDIESRDTPLSAAIETLIENRPKVGPSGGENFFTWALSHGYDAFVYCLLSNGDIDHNLRNKAGQSLLSIAAKNGHEAVVKLLLSRDDVYPNAENQFGLTPLLSAAENGHEAVVKLLLSRDNVDPNAENQFGLAPLLLAAASGYKAVVKLLLSRDDVDPNAEN